MATGYQHPVQRESQVPKVGAGNLSASGLPLRGHPAMTVAAADDPAIPFEPVQEEELMSSKPTAIRRNE